MNFNRNNLDKSSSPYLLQHTNNPIWWQEWSREVVEYASGANKPLFISSGYSTCHWCHVMASEAFSDRETADYLNVHFVCIKVDREQRPDIDQYLMDFMTSQNGNGGWPLNVFLTSKMRPVFAMTYAPVIERNSYPSFLTIAQKVFDFINENPNKVPDFIPASHLPPLSGQEEIVSMISKYFDHENGGFGNGQKFPSHTTLLYLLYFYSAEENSLVREICIKTLDAMRLRGLNDHLQGGIFRYCVDQGWNIPHFEKMLYDQVMALWTYSLAFRATGTTKYKIMAEDIITCLTDSFIEDGFFISAHDADTEHEEGATYLWSYEEIGETLTQDEFRRFLDTYHIEKGGNFEGKNHLIKNNDNNIKDIELKLLEKRKTRKQPSKDTKILCGLNALTAIAFIQAGRCLDRYDLEEKAAELMQKLLRKFWDGKNLGHSCFNGVMQNQSFLFDAGAMLTAITMLCENDNGWNNIMNEMALFVETLKQGDKWIESRADDFPAVDAVLFDHPVPSGISLSVLGLARASILKDGEAGYIGYRQPLQADFYNLACMVSNGLFHVYTSKEFIPWNMIPVNSLQRRGEIEMDCYRGVCRPL